MLRREAAARGRPAALGEVRPGAEGDLQADFPDPQGKARHSAHGQLVRPRPQELGEGGHARDLHKAQRVLRGRDRRGRCRRPRSGRRRVHGVQREDPTSRIRSPRGTSCRMGSTSPTKAAPSSRRRSRISATSRSGRGRAGTTGRAVGQAIAASWPQAASISRRACESDRRGYTGATEDALEALDGLSRGAFDWRPLDIHPGEVTGGQQ